VELLRDVCRKGSQVANGAGATAGGLPQSKVVATERTDGWEHRRMADSTVGLAVTQN
jgi:hypothetical protein